MTLSSISRAFSTAALVALSLSACTTTTQQGATGITRSQLLLVSSAEVETMAAQSYEKELQSAANKRALNTDKANLERIRRIADRLIPQVSAFRSDALAWRWEVNLETRDELNAYCAPGGKIMFFTGIITKLKLTDDEIAAIMGHEIAHALREHGRERVSQAYAQNAGLGIVGAITGMSQGTSALLQQAAQIGLTLPNGRGQESEADIMGLELLARAGYNPQAAVTLWQKMAAATGNSSGSFLSTHPGNAQRIKDLQAAMPKVMALYQQAKRNPGPSRAIVPRS